LVVERRRTTQDMPSIAVRRAVATDIPAVLSLYRELRPNDPVISSERILALWQEVAEGPKSVVLIAELDGKVASTCMLAMLGNLASDGRPIGVIEHVVTAARFRRRGLSRRLLEFALSEAWRANCCKVMLLSGTQRAAAHGLYEAVGFSGDVERGFVAKPPAPTSIS
jgi:GNAT superfamily N-acetyltransferase